MLKKFYEDIKSFIKEEYKFIIFLVLFSVICFFPVNYYIVIGGGISDISDRVIVEDGYDSKGSFNLSYVSELKGTALSYLLSYVMPHWKRIDMDDYKYTETDDYKAIEFRSELDLKYSNSNAIYYAYKLAGRECNYVDTKVYVISTLEEYDNLLEVGDQLVSVNGKECHNMDEFQEELGKIDENEVVIGVIRNNKEKDITCHLYQEDDRKVLGVLLQALNTYEASPDVDFNFERNESGPSAGLITTLSIYDQLTKGDLTKGKKIAGTGTIEIDGSIGSIGEVEYKLLGAVDGGADIFLVPAGDNYRDAKKEAKKEKLDIKIIPVKNIEDAINKLKDL